MQKGSNVSDVLLVLGGGLQEDGTMALPTEQRVQEALRLYKDGVAPNILLSGRWGFLSPTIPPCTEAQAMKDYLLAAGVEARRIFLEETSEDTIGNAYFSKQIVLAQGWKRVIVVTSDFHKERTRFLFAKVFGDTIDVEVVPVDSGFTTEQMEGMCERERKVQNFTRQWMGDVEVGNEVQVEAFLYRDHPAYAKNPTLTKEDVIKMFR